MLQFGMHRASYLIQGPENVQWTRSQLRVAHPRNTTIAFIMSHRLHPRQQVVRLLFLQRTGIELQAKLTVQLRCKDLLMKNGANSLCLILKQPNNSGTVPYSTLLNQLIASPFMVCHYLSGNSELIANILQGTTPILMEPASRQNQMLACAF